MNAKKNVYNRHKGLFLFITNTHFKCNQKCKIETTKNKEIVIDINLPYCTKKN